MRRIVVGFAGRAGSGKDTAASAIEDDGYHAVYKTAFAEELKRIVAGLYGLSREQTHGRLKETPVPGIGKSPRQIMRLFGTEVCRTVHPDTWVDAWIRSLRYIPIAAHDGCRTIVTVSDVRFPNEVSAIHNLGGKVYWIDRYQDNRPSMVHASEQSIDQTHCDYVIFNEGTELDFRETVRTVVFANIAAGIHG